MNQLSVNDLTETQDLLELRTFAYDILRRVFLAEPTKEVVTQLQNGIIDSFPFKDENMKLNEGIEQVSNYLKTFTIDKNFEQLHWDYTRMFIGPYQVPVPIWESAYVNKDGLLFQEETLQVRRLYLKNNLLSMQFGREAEDHLGLELDFMYHLSNLLTDLVKEENVEQLYKTVVDQNSFLKEHLLNWTPQFCEKVSISADTGFYKGMAKILNGFLLIDKICLEELLARTKQ
ncbi:TorA maturation chaperone TorD [Neobacillus niacini]|uniref:TorD/DmsD family molecular chaperone n=1 Tax=Neobacillus niacini TaxID=86668 RepID=UPI00285ED738|nr:molecular chaperone TorD family protein [Neobacillus niacini]MDR7076639.1 TorA maturation chaperone TorD [Neobacillus niacini]